MRNVGIWEKNRTAYADGELINMVNEYVVIVNREGAIETIKQSFKLRANDEEDAICRIMDLYKEKSLKVYSIEASLLRSVSELIEYK